jgi:hypothetical protein
VRKEKEKERIIIERERQRVRERKQVRIIKASFSRKTHELRRKKAKPRTDK